MHRPIMATTIKIYSNWQAFLPISLRTAQLTAETINIANLENLDKYEAAIMVDMASLIIGAAKLAHHANMLTLTVHMFSWIYIISTNCSLYCYNWVLI